MLDQVEHARILADFEHVCTTAGVQGKYLHESMTKYCSESETDWVRYFRKYREQGCPGLVLDGVQKPDTRCQAIAAALVRNFIDARVVPLNTLLDSVDADAQLSPTVLLVPNLYVASATGKGLPGWRIQMTYDLLLQRSVQGKPSVVYVENMSGVKSVYGNPFADFLEGFRRVTA